MVKNLTELEPAIDEATEQMRKARRLIPTETDNFVVDKSDKFADLFIGLLAGISGAAGAIGMITLIGAAIGLMNIMLVAVSERTREVGLIKAIGGKRKDVRRQFLFESVCISLLGAVFGIILGVGVVMTPFITAQVTNNSFKNEVDVIQHLKIPVQLSSTIPIALSEAQKEEKLQGNVLIAGFGVGYSWGATILKYKL
jgi:ABC-type antimicrobial peptide transport system permease subunit